MIEPREDEVNITTKYYKALGIHQPKLKEWQKQRLAHGFADCDVRDYGRYLFNFMYYGFEQFKEDEMAIPFGINQAEWQDYLELLHQSLRAVQMYRIMGVIFIDTRYRDIIEADRYENEAEKAKYETIWLSIRAARNRHLRTAFELLSKRLFDMYW